MSEKNNLFFEAENLAVPEVHTGKEKKDEEESEEEQNIRFDTLAIPEIKITHE